MGKRGTKPQGRVPIKWSKGFAYAIGLLTTDGNLSPDGRHICFTSKDLELAEKFQKALGIRCHIGKKNRGGGGPKIYSIVQFSDVLFYQFLLKIGLMPRKSKIIGALKIPRKFFFDFLRGHFDGDGSFYSYWDRRWKSSYMFYTVFISASLKHIEWLRNNIHELLRIRGHITYGGRKASKTLQLKFAKSESRKLLRRLYKGKSIFYLIRKYQKIQRALNARMEEPEDSHA